jgi:hypothetical protein
MTARLCQIGWFLYDTWDAIISEPLPDQEELQAAWAAYLTHCETCPDCTMEPEKCQTSD